MKCQLLSDRVTTKFYFLNRFQYAGNNLFLNRNEILNKMNLPIIYLGHMELLYF